MKISLKSLIAAVLLAGMLGGSLLAVNNMIVNVPTANRNLEIRNVVRDNDGNELIDIDEDELITGSSYQELMSAKQAENKLYILARVLSKDNQNQLNVHYYDAHAVNHWFFNDFDAPFKTLDQYKSPANNLPVVAIDYFTINPMTNNQVFNHLCSFDTLVGDKASWRNYFHTNQPLELSELSPEVKFERGMYSLGAQDYTTASTYFEQIVANPADNPRITAMARYYLGKIYYNGGNGVPKNYTTASTYLEQIVANPLVNPEITAKARLRLGEIYYTGGHGVTQNFTTARSYFEQILANAQDDPEKMAIARLRLGEIYYTGGHGVPKNYTTARTYFEQVVADPHAGPLSQYLAQEYFDILLKKQAEIRMRLSAIVQEKKDIKKSNVSQEEKNTQLEVLRAEEKRLKAECGNKSSCTVQ